MSWRRQLAVASPVSIAAVGRAFVESVGSGEHLESRARALIEREFPSSHALLTDSGTSALVLALRLAVPPGGAVGFPGYACVDLTAAALRAGVKVRLYDINPATLGPDLDSVEAMLERGVATIVVAHLFGYPADVPAVRRLAAAYGVTVIEDAAQGAGGRLGGKRLGTLGDLSVLSFGRGKGLCAGGGGALLGFGDRWIREVERLRLQPSGKGWRGLAATGVQWALGRPSLYTIPSSIPWLHLGEMVYHAAGEPMAMASGSQSMLASAMALEASDLAARRRTATVLQELATNAYLLGIPNEILGAQPGYLRYAVRDLSGTRQVAPKLGVLRSYPRTLAEQVELLPALLAGVTSVPGAMEIRRSLFTLPTHRFVRKGDVARIGSWLANDGRRGVIGRTKRDNEEVAQ